MRILVLGEGPNDLGRIDRSGLLTLPGALPILIERLCRDVEPSGSIDFNALPWKSGGLRAHSGSGLHKKLELAAATFGRDVDAIVAVVDRDGAKNRSRAEQLHKGRELVLRQKLSCAVGLSVEMLEATLLADETALRAALDDPLIECQPDPEKLVSRVEQHDGNPKGRLQRLISRSPAALHDRDFTAIYAEIARHARLAVLEARCPTGFGEFARQVRDMAAGNS